MSSSSSSSSSATDSTATEPFTKTRYDKSQLDVLDAVCACNIDPVAAAEAMVASLGDDMQQMCKLEYSLTRGASNLELIRKAVHDAKHAKYGPTFECSNCHRHYKADYLMWNRDRYHKQFDSFTPAISGSDCRSAVCYNCAMTSGTTCPVCKKDIGCWYGGPADKPYIIVMDMRAGVCGKEVRLEGSLDLTVRQLRDMLKLDTKDKVRVADSLTGHKMDSTLKDLGADVWWMIDRWSTLNRQKIVICRK